MVHAGIVFQDHIPMHSIGVGYGSNPTHAIRDAMAKPFQFTLAYRYAMECQGAQKGASRPVDQRGLSLGSEVMQSGTQARWLHDRGARTARRAETQANDHISLFEAWSAGLISDHSTHIFSGHTSLAFTSIEASPHQAAHAPLYAGEATLFAHRWAGKKRTGAPPSSRRQPRSMHNA